MKTINRHRWLTMLAITVFAITSSAQAALITSIAGGVLSGPNEKETITFGYDPLINGSILDIQSWGYGGTADAPGGTNATGFVIPAGGFDPIIALFLGTGAGATIVPGGVNDDGNCPPGHASPFCFDSTLHFTSLGAGTYTLVLTAFSNFPIGPTFGDGYTNTGTFDGRTSKFAFDVVASNPVVTDTPEPATLGLIGGGLVGIGLISFRKRSKTA